MTGRILGFTVLCCWIFSLNCQAAEIALPEGWTRPNDPLFNQKWRSSDTHGFLKLDADLNCDGFTDSAMILQPVKGDGIGLYVFLGDGGGNYLKPICLYNSMENPSTYKDLSKYQRQLIQQRFRTAYGIKLVRSGRYKTACGKGYYDCSKGEPEEISLECGGIDFFLVEAGGNKFFYWDKQKKKFLSQVMSD